MNGKSGRSRKPSASAGDGRRGRRRPAHWEQEPWRPPLRGAWMVNMLVLAAGIFGAAGLLLGQFHARSSDFQNVLATTFGIVGTILGWVLGGCGFLIVLVLGIVTMAKGAALRGILAIIGFPVFALLSLGMVFGGVLYQVKQGKHRGTVASHAPEENSPRPIPAVAPRPAEVAPRPVPEAAKTTPTRPALRLPKGETTLTNQKGQSFSGRIFGVTDWDVLMKQNGRELVVEIKTLDEASQEKVRRWKAGN